jgi:uncharacterized membrane protein YgcG
MTDLIRIGFAMIFLIALSCATNRPEEKISIEHRIQDNANLLSADQEDSIFALIQKVDSEVGSQIAVYTIDSLGDQKLEEVSLNKASTMGLGRATHNDGILITIAVKDRMVRIEVGTGLENVIKGEVADQVIREEIAPRFREKRFGLGIYNAIDMMSSLISGNKELVGVEPKD